MLILFSSVFIGLPFFLNFLNIQRPNNRQELPKVAATPKITSVDLKADTKGPGSAMMDKLRKIENDQCLYFSY